ncbi:MAG: glycerophosphodiester phosphodiesterase family protein [Albidovulum sp.]|nr:glycerophosphodiester phosphodiesterase family protein [Albidovulum sp.]MDE0532880.1 glycerophosphodiester phosphodiesterase family protein [Albidovulum sp.]
MFHLLASRANRIHVCAHRGNSVDRPENTMAAFQRAVDLGCDSLEIDVVLSADNEIVLLHDLTVDRTTNGQGFAEDLSAFEITALDAGSKFHPGFSGERVPLLKQVLEFACDQKLGLFCEIKDRGNEDRLIARLAELLESTGAMDSFVAISFDHQQLDKAKNAIPGLRTEGITHSRHVDPAGFVATSGLDAIAVEIDRFLPEDGVAFHSAGVSVRCHVPRQGSLENFERYGRKPRSIVGDWVARGVLDTLSGDDVGYLSALAEEYSPY